MGLLPLFRDPAESSIVLTLVGFASNFQVWWSARSDFRPKAWGVTIIGLIFGLPIEMFFFDKLGASQLRIAIGFKILLAVVLMLAVQQIPAVGDRIKRTGYRPGWPVGVIAGFPGGFLGGAVAIPGPPMILYGAFMLAAGFWSGR